jgi:hypothetical protein
VVNGFCFGYSICLNIFVFKKIVQNLLKNSLKAIALCRLSDLSALHFNVLTFVNKILTTCMKNAVNVYF